MEDIVTMNRRHALVAYVLVACTLLLGLIARAAETRKGSWTIARSDEPGKVSFGLIYHDKHNNSNHQSDWPVSDFKGVDFAKSGKQDVKFLIARDAGKFDCEGFLDNGEGAGVFHFTADPQYVSRMSSLGFTGIDEEKQFAMAIFDVSLDYANEMKSRNLKGLDADKLIAFRIFNVTQNFIDELRKSGLPAADSDKLIAFRIHGVSPEFIEKLATLGYKHPEPDQLVAMRIHGVSPEFISDMQSRGMKNLTVDQLVNLRIHGID